MHAPVKAARVRDPVSNEIATAVRHSFVYGIGGVLVKGIGFLLLPLYTRYLSPSDYGLLEMMELSISLLAMFLNMGITAALLRFYGAAETEFQKRQVVGSIFLFAIATAAVVFLAGSLVIRPASAVLLGPDISSTYLLLAFVAFLVSYIGNVPYTALRAKEASVRIATFDTLSTIGLVILNVYFIAVLHMSVVGMLLSRLLIAFVSVFVLVYWTSRDLLSGLDRTFLRRAIGFGAPLVFSNLTMFMLNFSDRFFLQRFQSLEVVGMYAVGYKFAYMLNFLLIQPFNMMWQARMYVIHRRPDHKKIFARIFALYSATLLFAGLGIAMVGPELLAAMADPRYAAGGSVIAVVTLGYVFLGGAYYLQLGTFLTSRTGAVGLVSTAATILNLVANYFLIMYFGMFGAAWATVLGFLAIAVGSYYCSERVCPLGLPVGRVLRMLAVAVVLYLLAMILPQFGLVPGLLSKVSLMVCFPVLLWACGCFSHEEVATVRSVRDGAVRRTLQMLRPAWRSA